MESINGLACYLTGFIVFVSFLIIALSWNALDSLYLTKKPYLVSLRTIYIGLMAGMLLVGLFLILLVVNAEGFIQSAYGDILYASMMIGVQKGMMVYTSFLISVLLITPFILYISRPQKTLAKKQK
jgi:hypothetical protein